MQPLPCSQFWHVLELPALRTRPFVVPKECREK